MSSKSRPGSYLADRDMSLSDKLYILKEDLDYLWIGHGDMCEKLVQVFVALNASKWIDLIDTINGSSSEPKIISRHISDYIGNIYGSIQNNSKFHILNVFLEAIVPAALYKFVPTGMYEAFPDSYTTYPRGHTQLYQMYGSYCKVLIAKNPEQVTMHLTVDDQVYNFQHHCGWKPNHDKDHPSNYSSDWSTATSRVEAIERGYNWINQKLIELDKRGS